MEPKEFEQLKDEVRDVNTKVDKVLNLLQGDELFGEVGFVKSTKSAIIDHDERIGILEEEKVRNSLLKQIIWWLIGSVIFEAMGIIILLVTKNNH